MKALDYVAKTLLFFTAVIPMPPAKAEMHAMRIFESLSKVDLVWGDLQTVSIAGQPVYWRTFKSPEKLMTVAARLSDLSGLFQRVLLLQGKVLLSGVKGNRHWVAELTPGIDGVGGILSMLPLVSTQNSGVVYDPLRWMETLARRHFVHETVPPFPPFSLRIYSAPESAEDLVRSITQRLLAQGWSGSGRSGPDGFQYWKRDFDFLMLSVQSVGIGSTVFVHLSRLAEDIAGVNHDSD